MLQTSLTSVLVFGFLPFEENPETIFQKKVKLLLKHAVVSFSERCAGCEPSKDTNNGTVRDPVFTESNGSSRWYGGRFQFDLMRRVARSVHTDPFNQCVSLWDSVFQKTSRWSGYLTKLRLKSCVFFMCCLSVRPSDDASHAV